MSTQLKHPDFQKEFQRLEFTKRYMEAVIKTAETNQDQFQENMLEAFQDVDWSESSLGYSSLLTNASFFAMSKDELASLKKARTKPYFARIDFSREDQQDAEIIYIGKTSLYSRENQEQIIVDWRSPISNLYYEGRIGEVHYQSYEESFKGELVLKRQFMIEEGEIEEIRDIDLTTNDQLLQESLSGSSSNRLTEIVSTIQEEQNRIIRADLHKPIIVQGGAGSGKTTIALHRISYFIYQYKENFAPEQLMILAPSRLFIDYISEALPELGVERVRQTTFEDYVRDCIGKQIRLKKDSHLINLLEHPEEKETLEAALVSKLKGSPMFQTVLNNYMKDIYQTFFPADDFFVDKYRLFKRKRFIQLLQDEFHYLPLYRRVEKLKAILQSDVRRKKKEMIDKVELFYDEKIERALYNAKDPDKRRAYVSAALDKKSLKLTEIKKAIKSAVPSYMKQFSKKTVFQYYHALFNDPKKLVLLSDSKINPEQAELICKYNQTLFKKKIYEREDLALLLYLHVHLNGIDKEYKAKNIVIDEAQDYSFMEILSLKKAVDTDMFTLVGDLAQGIHSYRGLTSWDAVQAEIFPRATYAELKKSYRTTVEIMEMANQLLKRLPYGFPEVEPVVRHGKSPQFTKSKKGKALIEQLEKQIDSLKAEKFKSFAMIGKTMKDCETLYKQFQKHSSLPVLLLGEEEKIPKDVLVIVPAYLAKGLEFDAVIIFSIDERYSAKSNLDIQLLYVAMTRPLHRLCFFGEQQEDFLLK
ncbi:RNA polymerase recycling motor HelD [Cytobacillus purgationiresistens]|uniref:DNA helicase-2/ATP-dependent DNA helicase PcrA n=1 Tax=Cytobacillus purgationiresistens TaxID=863449 RepID=A0ABU0AQV5_9BACI|nr:RNA polymerase recycling motor HelD [Cytobacillus purgationiresistens]MDQ0273632.1 DNA helicase-2/ATP-dependent DNA helicase PcrA [Cytobacillus purgationiresistens]